MRESEKIIASSLFFLVLITWLAFALHVDSRFAGSFWGTVLGIAAAGLMVLSFLYILTRRLKSLRSIVTRYVSLRTLLTIHIFAGLFGPILAILHTGHKFHSPLGIALTATMLLVVASGFVGRYLFNFISDDLREKRAELSRLEQLYHATAIKLQQTPGEKNLLLSIRGFFMRPLATHLFRSRGKDIPLSFQAVALSEAIADVEYSILMHEVFKRRFSRWLITHLISSVVFLLLLGAHIFSSLYFGLRWLQ